MLIFEYKFCNIKESYFILSPDNKTKEHIK